MKYTDVFNRVFVHVNGKSQNQVMTVLVRLVAYVLFILVCHKALSEDELIKSIYAAGKE